MLSREGGQNQGAGETPCFNRLRLYVATVFPVSSVSLVHDPPGGFVLDLVPRENAPASLLWCGSR